MVNKPKNNVNITLVSKITSVEFRRYTKGWGLSSPEAKKNSGFTVPENNWTGMSDPAMNSANGK